MPPGWLSVAAWEVEELVTAPPPESELTVWLKLPRSSVAPELTVVALAALKVFAAPAFSAPA